jgi:hypothetical protein
MPSRMGLAHERMVLVRIHGRSAQGCTHTLEDLYARPSREDERDQSEQEQAAGHGPAHANHQGLVEEFGFIGSPFREGSSAASAHRRLT